MAMAAVRARKTVADYMKLPDEPRVELIGGEFYLSPSPNERHQRALINLAALLLQHVKKRKLGRVYVAPFDCILSTWDVVQPDLLFMASEHLDRIRDRVHGPPDLAVEILSPYHTERDRIVKRILYAKRGIREYWMVDPEERTVEVRILRGRSRSTVGLFGALNRLRSSLLPAFRPRVREIFE